MRCRRAIHRGGVEIGESAQEFGFADALVLIAIEIVEQDSGSAGGVVIEGGDGVDGEELFSGKMPVLVGINTIETQGAVFFDPQSHASLCGGNFGGRDVAVAIGIPKLLGALLSIAAIAL